MSKKCLARQHHGEFCIYIWMCYDAGWNIYWRMGPEENQDWQRKNFWSSSSWNSRGWPSIMTQTDGCTSSPSTDSFKKSFKSWVEQRHAKLTHDTRQARTGQARSGREKYFVFCQYFWISDEASAPTLATFNTLYHSQACSGQRLIIIWLTGGPRTLNMVTPRLYVCRWEETISALIIINSLIHK